MILVLLALLLSSQIYLEKKGLPQKLTQLKFRYALLGSLVVIALSMLIGSLLGIGVFLTASTTIVVSVFLAHKFRSKYTDMERGKTI